MDAVAGTSDATAALLTGAPPCGICDRNASKYMCPRCGISYCSLSCYRNESKHLQCSESFYKDCVVQNIKAEQKQNPESAKKMMEILQRVQQQSQNDFEEGNDDDDDDELDSDDDEPLEKRLKGVDLNNAEDVWKQLTVEEKREFQSLVKSVETASNIIPEWIPWWNDEPEKKLVVDVSEGSSEGQSFLKFHKRQPDWLQPIPKMSTLTKVNPNQHVAKGLINVVAAYVWAARLFNGDIFDPAKIIEVASCMIFLSSFLNKDGVFKNVEHAIADVPLNACQVPILSDGGDAIQTNLSRDIWTLVKGPEKASRSSNSSITYLLSALTECYNVFVMASKALKRKCEESNSKSNATGESFSKLFPTPPPVLSADLKLVNKAKRKLLYLLAFANEYVQRTSFE